MPWTRFAVEGSYDYASNTLRPTFPDGLDVEVAKFDALAMAWREATGNPAFGTTDILRFLAANPAVAALRSIRHKPE